MVCSAFISGSEAAYFSLSPQQLDKIRRRNDKKSKMVLEQLGRVDFLLGTILQANNFINITLVLLSAFFINSLVDFTHAPLWGFFVQTVIVTLMLVLFGEVMPKIVASQYPEQCSQKMAMPLRLLEIVARPFNLLMVRVSTSMNKNMTTSGNTVSIEELSQAVDITGGAEVEEKKMLKGIVGFVSTDVRKIMSPRVAVSALEVASDFGEVKKTIIESGYSRLPVYEGNLDTIKGFLYVKDLLPYMHTQGDDFDWHTLIRSAYFVPESKKINDLLEEFREKKIHLAVVVDEYGGTEGVVTLEDILEEIIGEISDETDEE